jgi:hypothetical protein
VLCSGREVRREVSDHGARETAAETEEEKVKVVCVRRVWIGLPLLASLALFGAPTRLAAQSTPSVAAPLEVQTILEVKKTTPGSRVPVTVRLVNRGATPVGPFEMKLRPLPLDPAAPVLAPRLLVPGQSLAHAFTLLAEHEGTYAITLWLVDAGGEPLLVQEAGTLEVASTAWIGPSAPAIIAAILTIVGTIFVQVMIWRLNRRQRSTEAVTQMVVGMARDYFGTMSGTLVELTRAVKALRNPDITASEREHLRVRAFFFFGIFLHKENQFAFDQGVMYLPHLWAEGAVGTIVAAVLRLVDLTKEQEAVVHKCFSDIAIMQRGVGDAKGVDFAFRTLFDFERMLRAERQDYAPVEQRRVRAVYDAVKAKFDDPDVMERIEAFEKALRAIIDYEFTVIFEDVYVNKAQDRDLPVAAPRNFDAIIDGVTWAEVRARVLEAGPPKTDPGP